MSVLKPLRLPDDLAQRVTDYQTAERLPSFTAAAVALMLKGLDGDGGAVLDALPTPPRPPAPSAAPIRKAAKAPVPTRITTTVIVTPERQTPPTAGRSRVSGLDIQVGAVRPAYGSRLKGPKR